MLIAKITIIILVSIWYIQTVIENVKLKPRMKEWRSFKLWKKTKQTMTQFEALLFIIIHHHYLINNNNHSTSFHMIVNRSKVSLKQYFRCPATTPRRKLQARVELPSYPVGFDWYLITSASFCVQHISHSTKLDFQIQRQRPCLHCRGFFSTA